MDRSIVKDIRKRQLKLLGHIIREGGLESDCLLGRIEGVRARGRQRMKFVDSLLDVVGEREAVSLVRMAFDREQWRSMVANVT